ncbi:IucA/IucC family protein [Streptomyces sp. ITFR-16]|uniref:IucA/IucC family protein n=1 Tax=Streptomyces sp. ITFR-16 TaxID=3075198 RepID=UPI00288B037E|nr:IucA/IucC family protein [Streptomyces sp. ITFR-16]WNI26622.1 IucA/IucC family protein [Streptomyces sp. ITFR-16]
MPSTTTRTPARATFLPTADDAVAHTLLNCLLREATAPEDRTLTDGRLVVRLPHLDTLLRIGVRRTSLLGAHRFSGAAGLREVSRGGAWQTIGWQRLAELVHGELTLRTGTDNDEFLSQVAASHRAIASSLVRAPARTPDQAGAGDPLDAYLASEQSLLLGHRFHPTPKAHGADPDTWAAYAPEEGARFPLRLLAVRDAFLVGDTVEPGGAAALDRAGEAPPGYRLLPAHPWQFRMLGGHPALRAALARRDVLDLGSAATPVTPTASVRTVHDGTDFLKFSLDVRITNCLRKNSSYELTGAVALTRLLGPVLADLAARHPRAAVLREPAYRSLALPGADGRPDRALLEGFGVIVREGLTRHTPEGATPLLAAAVADEYPLAPGRALTLLADAGPEEAAAWWRRYTAVLIPPVLTAFFRHGVVLEPHLQNVVVCFGPDGLAERALFRDLEGTKLLRSHHAEALRELPHEVAGPLTYDRDRGWNRVVYCLLVNHIAEVLAAVADLHPETEPALWRQVRTVLESSSGTLGRPRELRALLAGAPLPAKANLLTRWRRSADRDAGYVRLPSPLAPAAANGRRPT